MAAASSSRGSCSPTGRARGPGARRPPGPRRSTTRRWSERTESCSTSRGPCCSTQDCLGLSGRMQCALLCTCATGASPRRAPNAPLTSCGPGRSRASRRRARSAYTDDTLRQRLSFAEGYARWTEDDWSRVMFSDETHFRLGQYGREYVQRPVGMALDPKYTKQTEQLKGKVSLWGCICADGLGHAELYSDSLNA